MTDLRAVRGVRADVGARPRSRSPPDELGQVRDERVGRDPTGVQRARQFVRKGAADQFAASVETDKVRGSYVDPKAGRMTLQDYGAAWLSAQTFDPSTREAVELRLRLHVYPTLGTTALSALRPSQVQAWLRGLQQALAPRYVRVIFANLSAVLAAAVDDERIVRNPCRAASVKPPAAPSGEGRALDAGTGRGCPARPAVPVSGHGHAGRGLWAEAGRGLWAGSGRRRLPARGRACPPAGQAARRSSGLRAAEEQEVRHVPLPESVALDLAAHLQAWPAVPIDLPWQDVSGARRSAELLLSTRETTALQRNYVDAKIWKPALTAAGIAPSRENGMHALRHFYASVLLDAGESVRALAEYLGHADPGFTLRLGTHRMPASEERTKRAVDQALRGGTLADGSTGCAPDVHREAL